ncbi:MAG: aminotransferase [Hyphomonas sp. TMED17]|nr:MAG: aminotransferase [Hyphomonas sp. TMED17]
MIYVDYNATAPLRPESRAAIVSAFEVGANPSSIHQQGRQARHLIETARAELAHFIGARARDIVFTSGGTEANALALAGTAQQLQGNVTMLVSAIEHDAVRSNATQAALRTETLRVDSNGVVDLEMLKNRLVIWDVQNDGVPVVAIMLANNETGIIQPVRAVVDLVKRYDGFVHCDAVQALGKIPVDVTALGVDYLALSAHKIGGPQGVGALWVRSGAPLRPLLVGGGQERSLRSGTENLLGIAGFGAACVAASQTIEFMDELSVLRDQFEDRLMAAFDIKVFGRAEARLPQTSNFALEGFSSEIQVMALDLEGIAVSSGAACSSGKVSRSHVLQAMGVDRGVADCALRASFGWASTADDVAQFADVWIAAARRAVLREKV